MPEKRKKGLSRNLDRLMTRARRALRFRSDFRRFAALSERAGGRLPVRWGDRYPCLKDDVATTAFAGHYLLHTAWAARKVAKIRPPYHTDFSSSLDFNALVSAFVPIRFYDYRPADAGLSGLETGFADLTDLPFADGALPSVSCMHVVEHVGLGRYGDAMDADGDLKAMAELARVTAPGGNLLFVVPVGAPRVQFNAHRIYGHGQVLAAFPGFTLREFALIADGPEDTRLIVDAPPELVDRQRYGCGCFWFEKA